MTGDYWAITWGERVWTNAPTEALNGTDAESVTLGHYAQVARQLEVDDWAVCQPSHSPVVLAVWIQVLGVSGGVWADMGDARLELADTPLSVLAAALVSLQDEG